MDRQPGHPAVDILAGLGEGVRHEAPFEGPSFETNSLVARR